MIKKLAALIGACGVVCGVVVFGAAPANADTKKCRTEGSVTYCDIFGDDGSWHSTETWCDKNGDCTTTGN
jgi:hypothetical protein